jgi:hypothetical protein
MSEWLPIGFQVVSTLFTIGGVVVAVSTRMAKLEGRIDSLAIEIRKDRELVEHRIRQLEIGLGQVRSELTRLSFSVGSMKGRDHPHHQETDHE